MTSLQLGSVVAGLVGEEVEQLVDKHSAVIALTTSHAIKIYASREPTTLPRAGVLTEWSWLRQYGELDSELREGLDAGGTAYIAIVMPRLPDEACVGRRMLERTLGPGDIGRIVKRVEELHTKARSPLVSAHRSADAMTRNLRRQLRLLGDEIPASMSEEMRRQADIAVSVWLSSSANGAITTVEHSNLFGPNIFLLERLCVLIDPGLRYPEARLMPRFTELAPLLADLALHSYAGLLPLDRSGQPGPTLSESERSVLRTAVITKVLVRARFALLEADRQTTVGWVREQNLFIRKAALPATARLLEVE